ncbi:hypothetical protein H6P81_007517 [Aristolochia fimbriata]|uniref:J domain-containing protein n=1 Tax=Aristolochia fimbriata TaxID=158543 RepID=A0AAV7F0P5_ARIFI|nr:hypothetical protein H6P81_007517 [Aristolochia fimbriata]
MNMHGISRLLTPLSLYSLFLPPRCHAQGQIKFSNPFSVNRLRIHFTPPSLNQNGTSSGNFCRGYRSSERRKKKITHLRASPKETPYDVLGVSPSATPEEIKRAYRRLALKFHPDVNKETNAQEKFMRIKHAYNTLLNSKSQRKYGSRSSTSDYGSPSYERQGNNYAQDEENFYGFEDFFRDLQTEFLNWEANAGSQGKPKSLWDELADIGEEFVEFLEKELNISESNSGEEDSNIPFEKNESKGSGNVQGQGGKRSSIEENIDEIEAALAQLKKELGL